MLPQVSVIATRGAALRGMSLRLCREGSSFNFFCSLGLERTEWTRAGVGIIPFLSALPVWRALQELTNETVVW